MAFSRVTKQIAGEELIKDQQRRSSKGLLPIEKPYTQATIYDAEIVPVNPNGNTSAEIYGRESFYHSKSHSGYNFTANNKSKQLPWIGTSTDGGKTVNQITPEGELANDLNVILVLRIFKTKRNNGQSLDGIIVLDPIRYYTGNNDLSQYGITFNPVPTPVNQTTVEKPVGQVITQTQSPVQSPVQTPVQTPVQPPVQIPVQQPNMVTPFSAQQSQATPFGNPQTHPFSNTQNTPFNQPVNNQNDYSNSGIQYNPNEN